MWHMYERSPLGRTLTITLPTMVGLIGLFHPRSLIYVSERDGRGGGIHVKPILMTYSAV